MNQQEPMDELPATGGEHAKPPVTDVWAQSSPAGFWGRLPPVNQLLFAASFGCLGVGALTMVGPALVEGGQSAIFPYTSAGKRQTCLSNLEGLSRAFALYTQDSDGRLPAIEETASSRERVTWVTRLQPYAQRESSSASTWNCPLAAVAVGPGTSSYALNPVLAGQHLPQGEGAGNTLLLGDRGTRHDLSLLPPVPGWNAVSPSSDASATNLDFRHDGEAALLMADGHAAIFSPSGVAPLALWGGSDAITAGLKHIEAGSAASGALVKLLRAGDVPGATKLLQNPKPLATTVSELGSLWMVNWQEGGEGRGTSSLASEEAEEMGWHLARAQELDGQKTVRPALDAETKRRCEEERKRVEATGWQTQSASSGLRLEVPQGWVWSEENKDRYHTASARSPLPGLWVSVEKGDRTSSSAAIPVDWGASEKKLQAKYGQGYKRLRMETATLLGRPAGLWEYELEKAGSPRLRKCYIGTADGWNAYVLSVTAPANDFEAWRGDFDRIIGSLSLS